MPIDQAPSIPFTITDNLNIKDNSSPMAMITDKGEVTINWEVVEKIAVQTEHNELWGIARALLKARDSCK